MKTIYRILTITAAAVAFAACNKAVDNTRSHEIGLYAGVMDTRAANPADLVTGRDQTPLFLFWTAGNFDDATKSAPDFFVRTPSGVITDYESSKYNTGVYYPLYDQVVYSAGIAPAPGSGYVECATAGSYDEFVITAPNVPIVLNPDGVPYGDDKLGVADVLVTNTISGKDSAPLGMLTFTHALTKIGFRATLAPTMAKYVKYVTVKFPGSLAPVSATWNATAGTYVIGAGEDGTDDYVFGNYWTDNGTSLAENRRANVTYFYQVSKDDDERMGYTHIVPPGSSMAVTVQFKVADRAGDFDTTDFEDLRTVEIPVTINFLDASNQALELKAGDFYDITLRLDLHDIEIIGRLRPWENGGYVSIPYQPTR